MDKGTRTDDKQEIAWRFWHIKETTSTLNVPIGVNVKIYEGVAVDACYIFGGYVEVAKGAKLKNCIINSGELCVCGGANIGTVLAKHSSVITLRTGAKLKRLRQTGTVGMNLYPGTTVESPFK